MVIAINRAIAAWRRWQGTNINRRIFAAAILVAAVSFGAKLLSVIKDMTVAYQFGIGANLDAFLIAYLIPAFGISVLLSSFSAAFIPAYISTKEREGEGSARDFLASTVSRIVILLVLIVIPLALFGRSLLAVIAYGFEAQKLALAYSLFLILLPVLVISGVSSVWVALLNANRRHVSAVVPSMLSPLVAVVAVLLWGDAWGIYALATGVLFGVAGELALLGWQIHRSHLPVLPRWKSPHPSVRRMFAQLVPAMAGAIFMSGTEIINYAMATTLGSGSVSALSYGSKVVALILAIASFALGTAIFPHFSQLVAQRDLAAVRHILKTYVRLIVMSGISVTIIGIYLSEPLVRALFERGAFGVSDTETVAQVQMFYLLQIPFYILGVVGARLLNALSCNHALMKIALFNLLINVLGNYFLMPYYGVAGIALSTSIVYLLSSLMMFYAVFTRLKHVQMRDADISDDLRL